MSNKHHTKCGSERKAEIGCSTIEADIFAAATRFSDHTLTEMNKLLSLWGMTVLQHTTLRILYVHDRAGTGLSGNEIGQYLHTRVPDLTRLLDRLADKGWLVRERDAQNRRVVRSRLTDIGAELVESAHTSLQALEKEQLAHLSEADKQELLRLLGKALQA
jgi:DNA-binding MarR family transcriptional regulator